jgi:hypothetical protein
MAASEVRKNKLLDMESGQHLFDVTVETVIGSVHSGGLLNPMEAAFMLIGSNAQQIEAGPNGLHYSFPGPAENDRIEVTVHCTNPRTDRGEYLND